MRSQPVSFCPLLSAAGVWRMLLDHSARKYAARCCRSRSSSAYRRRRAKAVPDAEEDRIGRRCEPRTIPERRRCQRERDRGVIIPNNRGEPGRGGKEKGLFVHRSTLFF